MVGNYWEETVYSAPPLRGLDQADASTIFNWFGVHFPSRGSKIDWRRVTEGHVHWRIDDAVQLMSIACREICQRMRSGAIVEHAGDGLSPYGVRFSDDSARSIVIALLEIPEQHYFLAEDRSWVVVVTTEGDVDIVDRL